MILVKFDVGLLSFNSVDCPHELTSQLSIHISPLGSLNIYLISPPYSTHDIYLYRVFKNINIDTIYYDICLYEYN